MRYILDVPVPFGQWMLNLWRDLYKADIREVDTRLVALNWGYCVAVYYYDATGQLVITASDTLETEPSRYASLETLDAMYPNKIFDNRPKNQDRPDTGGAT